MMDFSLLDCVASPVFVLNISIAERPRFAFWNAALEEFSDIPRSQVLGMSPSRILSGGQVLVEAAAMIATTGLGDVRLTGLGPISLTLADDGKHLLGTVLEPDDEAQKDRELFLVMAAHDLRAPLRNISYLADELTGQALCEDSHQILDMITTVGKRAMALTDEVVSYSQAAGARVSDASRFDLSDAAAQVLETIDPAGRHHLSCPHVYLQTDKVALLILLRNLLDNALRHGSSERVVISLGVEATGNDGWLRFAVTDNGKGFDQPALAFLDGGNLRYDSGFGLLGLRRLVEARGGQIAAQTPQNGKGSEIIFTLPGFLLNHAKDAAVAVA